MVLLDVTASRCWQTLALTGLADREAGDQKPIDAYAEVGLALGSCGTFVMKQVSALGLLALAQWVTAQEECLSLTTNFPPCAFTCIVSAGSDIGCTDTADPGCRCTPASSEAIRTTALPCILSECEGNIGQIVGSALSAAASVCSCVEENPPGPTTTDDTTEEPTDPPTSTSESIPTTEPPPTTTADETSETITQPPETTCDPTSPCQESADAVPECGKVCIESAAVTDADCTPGDYECRCSAADVIQGAAQACVIDGCGVATALQVLESASALCDCVEASPTEPCDSEPTDTSTSDDDGGEESTKTEDSTHPPDTTKPPETTCEGGTTSDCGPVASTAIPGCAQQCFTSAAPDVGCDVDDFGCQCEEDAQASLTQILVPCVASNCPAASLEAVIAGAASVCACASAPPEGGDCPTTTGLDTPPPTTTDDDGDDDEPTTTCAEATRPDCGPVATSEVPECAQPCFTSAAPDVGCDVDDYGCQCEPDALASLSQLLVPCVATACPPASIPVVIEGASAVCECANAAPTGGDCGGGGPGPTHEPPPPTHTGGNPPEQTDCVPGSSADCGPVATSAVPECAQACFTSAAPDVGCGADDYACQCQPDTQESLTALLVPCVATACDSGELANIIAGAASVCACATAAPTGGDCPAPPTPTGGDGGGGGGGGGGDDGGDGGDGGGDDGGDGGDGGGDDGGDDGGDGGGDGGDGGDGDDGSDGGDGGDGGDSPGSPEPEPTGGEEPGDGDGGSGSEPTNVPEGSAARFEVGLVAGVFGAFWLAAVAL